MVGIGGIGMSGIAEILRASGVSLRGSDQATGANVRRLTQAGIPVFSEHAAENVHGAGVVVCSSAIGPHHPERAEAERLAIPVISRAEMLAELARLKWSILIGGSHGKTTTTSLVSAILVAADIDPTVVNGGIINAWGSNARLGSGPWLVAEADESDGSFIRLPSTIAILTNIDAEHMDHYGTFDNLRATYRRFIENLPFYGLGVVCIDDPEVQRLYAQITTRRLVTYGRSPQADIRAFNVQPTADSMRFSVNINGGFLPEGTLHDLCLPMIGEHNVDNALAAIGVARALNVPEDLIRSGLASFEGVRRRFSRLGMARSGYEIIDDYGHHPTEIRAVLKAARTICENNIVAIFQPHRFSRLSDLFDEFCVAFNDANHVIVTPVYSAGEEPIEGMDHRQLAAGLERAGHRGALAIEQEDEIEQILSRAVGKGGQVIFFGAGSISQWAHRLFEAQRLPGDAA